MHSNTKLYHWLHTFSFGILQFWMLRKWNRKHCARKSNSSLSGRGALMHERIPILALIPLCMILMSLLLPLHYLLLVKSISNPQAGNLLPVKLKHGGGTVSSSWYCKCQRAYWLSREGWQVMFGSPITECLVLVAGDVLGRAGKTSMRRHSFLP